jgi:hypothetical protein
MQQRLARINISPEEVIAQEDPDRHHTLYTILSGLPRIFFNSAPCKQYPCNQYSQQAEKTDSM